MHEQADHEAERLADRRNEKEEEQGDTDAIVGARAPECSDDPRHEIHADRQPGEHSRPREHAGHEWQTCNRQREAERDPEPPNGAPLSDEQQCYRQLAELAHARLAALQDAAATTGSFESRHRALLERQPPPRCEPAKAAAGASPVEAREATLDAERQCYKQLEAGERYRRLSSAR